MMPMIHERSAKVKIETLRKFYHTKNKRNKDFIDNFLVNRKISVTFHIFLNATQQLNIGYTDFFILIDKFQ